MTDELIKELLEAGVHFGHQTKRWNPKMKKFIFGERSGIYIIDLEKTVECLNQARDFLYDVAVKGGSVLFVGTKRQAQDTIEAEAKRAGVFYVNNRWLGGLLTNFQTVKKSVERLKSLEKMGEDGTFDLLTKKEVASLNKEKEKLLKDLRGIKEMKQHPQAVFIVDTQKEDNAVREANRLKIPVVALIDTNSDPDKVYFPIPGNDDALKSIRLVISLLVDSILEGRKQFTISEKAQEKIDAEIQEELAKSGVIDEELESFEETRDVDEKEKRGPTKVKLSRDHRK